jgi:hypothetical protein
VDGVGRCIPLGLVEGVAAVAVWGHDDEKNQRVLSELNAIGVSSVALLALAKADEVRVRVTVLSPSRSEHSANSHQ